MALPVNTETLPGATESSPGAAARPITAPIGAWAAGIRKIGDRFSVFIRSMGIREQKSRGRAAEHDRGYKRLFSQPKLVEELLRGFLSGDWIDLLDFGTLEKVGNSFVSDDLRERHSDLIWRLRLRGEGDGWVYLYLLLEFQSTSDPFMAVRLLTYVGLLLEEIVRKEKLKPGDRLPAVLPVVLYNGKGPWRAPLSLESLFVPVPSELRRHLPRLTYRLLDERRLDLDRPELQRNTTAALLRIETNEPPALPRLFRDLETLVKPQDPALRRTIQAWIAFAVQRAFPGGIIPEGVNPEEASMLEETLVKYFEMARQEGRQQARRDVLLEQMTLRFGRLPEEIRSQVEQITSDKKLERLARKILSAKSLEEMKLS